MDFSVLKFDFYAYLKQLENQGKIVLNNVSPSNSIFMFSEEFKDFMNENHNGLDSYSSSMSISELLDAINNDGDSFDKDVSDSDNEDSGNNLLLGVVRDLFKDSKIKDIIDTDKDSVVSSEEAAEFFNYIKDYDNDGESVSIDDIMNAVDEINLGSFEILYGPLNDSSLYGETFETPEQAQTAAVQNGYSGPSYYPAKKEKNLNTMSEEDLKTEKGNAQSDLTDKQKLLSSVLNGSHPDLKELKENIQTAKDNYINAIEDKELAAELNNAINSIDAKKSEINQNEADISNQKLAVSSAETSLNNAKSRQTCLETIISELESADVSDEESGANIAEKLASARAQLSDAKKAVSQAETKLEEENEKLSELEEKKIQFKSDLTELTTDKGKIEEQIDFVHNPKLLELKQAYEATQENYDRQEATLKITAETEVQKAGEYLNKIDVAISNKENIKTRRDLRPPNLGDDIMKFAEQFVGKNSYEMCQIMKSYGYQFDAGAWCADFTSFCLGVILGEDALPDWYRNINRAYCPSIMKHGQGHQLDDVRDAAPGDLVMLGIGGTGNDHAALFYKWADDEHNAYYTIERSSLSGSDGVAIRKRTIRSGDVGAIFRMTDG